MEAYSKAWRMVDKMLLLENISPPKILAGSRYLAQQLFFLLISFWKAYKHFFADN